MKVLVLVHRNQNCTRVCVRAPIGQWDIEKKGFFDESMLKKNFSMQGFSKFYWKIIFRNKKYKEDDVILYFI